MFMKGMFQHLKSAWWTCQTSLMFEINNFYLCPAVKFTLQFAELLKQFPLFSGRRLRPCRCPQDRVFLFPKDQDADILNLHIFRTACAMRIGHRHFKTIRP